MYSKYLSKMAEIRMHVSFSDIKDEDKFLKSVDALVKTIKVVIILINVKQVFIFRKVLAAFPLGFLRS